ncbi:MAG: GTP cyclohydrolase I FolE [Deltaproteobacteria bacterium]|nr:MAG: GTP cyclohydrolase I FolE [Deltaproteobacteria bacterium]
MTAEEAVRALIEALGWQDPELAHTPERVAEFLREYSPTEVPPISCFPHADDGVVLLRELPYYSLCVHHLVPFFGTATVAYVPDGRVAGLSGIARTLQALARRPQLQERLAAELADRLVADTGARALVVRLRARQMCMEMRGAHSTGEVEVIAQRGAVTDALLRSSER